MRAIVKKGATWGAQLVDDHPEPTVGPGEVLVEVAAVSVCGTDREIFEWTPSAEAFGLDLPVVLGHEFSGVVREVGESVRSVHVGDHVAIETHVPCGNCVTCRTGNSHNCVDLDIVAMHLDGAFAERVTIPESVCFVLPEGMSLEAGALLEPAGVAWHAIQRSERAVAGGSVLVSGCGPIGLLIIQFALYLGATEVIAVEPNPYRRALATNLGATAFSQGQEAAAYIDAQYRNRTGVDVAFESSGAVGAYPLLFEAVRKEGTIVGIGHPGHAVEIDVAHYINKKGITLRGVFGRRLWDTWEELVNLLASGRIDIEWVISHRLPLVELEEIINLLAGEANKVLIFPNGDPAAL